MSRLSVEISRSSSRKTAVASTALCPSPRAHLLCSSLSSRVRPVRLLRVSTSESLTQANSYLSRVGILMSVEFDRGSPGKFDSRTLNRKTLNRWTGRIITPPTSPHDCYAAPEEDETPIRTLPTSYWVRPIPLLTLSLLTLLDSNFPGNPLWAWKFHPFKSRSRSSPTL